MLNHFWVSIMCYTFLKKKNFLLLRAKLTNVYGSFETIFDLILLHLRWMIPPMVVHPEKIDFRRFV